MTPLSRYAATRRADSFVGIQTIPLEVLDKIFSFAVDDDCDLGLLLTSKSMARKLQHHPTVRVLSGLLTDEQVRMVFHAHIQEDSDAACWVLPALLGCNVRGLATQADLMGTNWCTPSFVGGLQIMLIKRLLETYWDPLLMRDGHPISAISHAYMWAELDEFQANPSALRNEWLIESRADAVRGCYPWVRVYVWPRQGRVLIRDQLVNRSDQYHVSLFERFLDMSNTSKLGRSVVAC